MTISEFKCCANKVLQRAFAKKVPGSPCITNFMHYKKKKWPYPKGIKLTTVTYCVAVWVLLSTICSKTCNGSLVVR